MIGTSPGATADSAVLQHLAAAQLRNQQAVVPKGAERLEQRPLDIAARPAGFRREPETTAVDRLFARLRATPVVRSTEVPVAVL